MTEKFKASIVSQYTAVNDLVCIAWVSAYQITGFVIPTVEDVARFILCGYVDICTVCGGKNILADNNLCLVPHLIIRRSRRIGIFGEGNLYLDLSSFGTYVIG